MCIFMGEDFGAVHLELLNSMTTEDFLQAFRRFAYRRGMGKVIHSDNQNTFHKAAIGRDLGRPPDAPPRKAEVSLSERFRYQQRLQSHFWFRWLREYLPGLTVHQQWTKEEVPLKQSGVVLISEDDIPRGKWKLGKIVDTFPGKDGRICRVRAQTKKGMINGSVQKLRLLNSRLKMCPIA